MKVFRHFRLHEEDGAAAAVYSVSLNPDGSLLATCGGDKLVRLWSTQLFKDAGAEPSILELNCGHYSLSMPPYIVSCFRQVC